MEKELVRFYGKGVGAVKIWDVMKWIVTDGGSPVIERKGNKCKIRNDTWIDCLAHYIQKRSNHRISKEIVKELWRRGMEIEFDFRNWTCPDRSIKFRYVHSPEGEIVFGGETENMLAGMKKIWHEIENLKTDFKVLCMENIGLEKEEDISERIEKLFEIHSIGYGRFPHTEKIWITAGFECFENDLSSENTKLINWILKECGYENEICE
jgi:hypothetical protein